MNATCPEPSPSTGMRSRKQTKKASTDSKSQDMNACSEKPRERPRKAASANSKSQRMLGETHHNQDHDSNKGLELGTCTDPEGFRSVVKLANEPVHTVEERQGLPSDEAQESYVAHHDGTTHVCVYCTRTSTEHPERIRHSSGVLSLTHFFLQ